MEAIASRAGVHVQTIYQAFGTKVAVLQAALSAAVAGDEDPEASFADWDWVRALLADTDSASQLRRFAAHRRDIAPRCGPLLAQTRDAARHDVHVGELLDAELSGEREGMLGIVGFIADRGDLRRELTPEEAADGVFALTAFDLYERLVNDRGWTAARYERWLGDRLCEYLLDPDRS